MELGIKGITNNRKSAQEKIIKVMRLVLLIIWVKILEKNQND